MKALRFILLAMAFITLPAHATQRNLMVTASHAQAQKRVALVIGNAAYQGAPALRNPVNDAKAISEALNGLGFEVIEVTDATQKEMNRAITAFGSKLNAETAALFFYAGHGMQVRGKNYIIPVDAQIEAEAAVATEAVSVDAVLEQLNASPVSIVILDACRNNPFERSFRKMGGGLAQMDAPKGSFIAYATAPGKTAADGDGKHGLFTQELLKQINEPGVELGKLFMRVRASVAAKSGDAQMPWDSSSMVGEFYFKPTQVASLEPVPSPIGGSVSLDDLKKQQETRAQWDKWQAEMKVDFDRIVSLNAAPDIQITAWERFLANYAQDNPYSAEDKQIRAQAQSKKQAVQAQQQQAAAKLEQQKQEAERQRQQATPRPVTNITPQQGYIFQGGLTWMPITSSTMAWSEANAYCTTTTINGLTGWRLPTKEELSALSASEAWKNQGWASSVTWSSNPGWLSGHYTVGLNSDMAYVSKESISNAVTCVHTNSSTQHATGNEPVMIRIPNKNYEIGKYEVKQGEWNAIMGSNPSRFTGCGDNCPVENITWNDAQVFIQKLNSKTGKQYRLPNEEEWEYACYGGTETEYCGGNTPDAVAWYYANSGSQTHLVGQRQPNGYGLFDMTGNVLEWTSECYKGDCSYRTLRGGSWNGLSTDLLTSSHWDRGVNMPNRFGSDGFRLARTLPTESEQPVISKTSQQVGVTLTLNNKYKYITFSGATASRLQEGTIVKVVTQSSQKIPAQIARSVDGNYSAVVNGDMGSIQVGDSVVIEGN